jgi:flagellar basal body-associated protein FliL
MSTQSYTANPGTTNQHVTNQHVTSPSRRRRWILAVAAVVTVAFAALALALWHGQSSAAPAINGPSTSTSVPAQPHTPANPAQPSRPAVNPAQPSGPAVNPAQPSGPTVDPAVPTTPAVPGSQS